MPIGYNPDVINPGGIDYAEVDNLINPPNPANAGKTIVIDETGKPTLGEGGGGGVNMIRIYAVDMPDTDPAMEEFPDVTTWEKSPDGYGLSLTENGEALSYSEIVALIENNPTAIFYYSGVSLIEGDGKQTEHSVDSFYLKGEYDGKKNITAVINFYSTALGVSYLGS